VLRDSILDTHACARWSTWQGPARAWPRCLAHSPGRPAQAQHVGRGGYVLAVLVQPRILTGGGAGRDGGTIVADTFKVFRRLATHSAATPLPGAAIPPRRRSAYHLTSPGPLPRRITDPPSSNPSVEDERIHASRGSTWGSLPPSAAQSARRQPPEVWPSAPKPNPNHLLSQLNQNRFFA
jgi:hypothetical protein